MRLLTVDMYGTRDEIHVDTAYIGQRGDLVIHDENKGRVLFAGAERLTETGWRFNFVCDEQTAAVITDAVRSGTDWEIVPNEGKLRLRDKVRARAARWRLSPVPAR